MLMNFQMLVQVGFLFAVAVVIAAIVAWSVRKWARPNDPGPILFSLFFAMSVTGAIVGYFSGLSRTGVAGNVLPAALVFISAGAAYIYTQESIEKAFLASMAIIAFSLPLGIEYYRSSYIRSEDERASTIFVNMQNELESIRDACLKFILSADHTRLPVIEKRRTRVYCGPYLPFLK